MVIYQGRQDQAGSSICRIPEAVRVFATFRRLGEGSGDQDRGSAACQSDLQAMQISEMVKRLGLVTMVGHCGGVL